MTAIPGRRVCKRDYKLLPALDGVPPDAFSKMVYDGIKANPGVRHVGVSTAPSRRLWRYSGSVGSIGSAGKSGAEITCGRATEMM